MNLLSSCEVINFDQARLISINRTYKLLNVLEFSSSRKRMSVIVKDEERRIFLLSKGADRSVIKLFIAFNTLEFLSEPSTY